jgi:hypothetical protein
MASRFLLVDVYWSWIYLERRKAVSVRPSNAGRFLLVLRKVYKFKVVSVRQVEIC